MSRNVWILLLVLLLAGCIRLDREMPQVDYFTLEAQRDDESSDPRFGVLRLQRIRAEQPFGGERFIYRPESLRFEEDYYHRFFAPPAELVGRQIRLWLQESGLFEAVLERADQVTPEYFLEGRILEIYGDFREAPQAVLSLEISLVHDVKARSETLLRRSYRRALPLERGTPDALAEGWSRALEEILQDLEADLRSIPRS